jgi:hypothetical protein
MVELEPERSIARKVAASILVAGFLFFSGLVFGRVYEERRQRDLVVACMDVVRDCVGLVFAAPEAGEHYEGGL